MSKTNHRRTGQSPRRDATRYRGSPMGGTGTLSTLADRSVGAGWGGDNSNGHRGHAQAKAGAKKYVRSRVRFHENATTRREAQLPTEP